MAASSTYKSAHHHLKNAIFPVLCTFLVAAGLVILVTEERDVFPGIMCLMFNAKPHFVPKLNPLMPENLSYIHCFHSALNQYNTGYQDKV